MKMNKLRDNNSNEDYFLCVWIKTMLYNLLSITIPCLAKAPWSWGRMYDFCTFFRMGRGIESQSFSLLIVPFSFIRLFDIIRLINSFHVAND